MRIRLSTVKFKGAGSIDCRICSHRTVFPDNAMVIAYNLAGAKQVILSASDGSRLHVCGLEYVWRCPTCGHEPDQGDVLRVLSAIQSSRARGSAHLLARLHRNLECPMCSTRFRQYAEKPVVHS